MIKLVGLWKHQSAAGDVYYSGSLGKHLQVLVFRNKNKSTEGQPDFEVFIKQREGVAKPGPTDGGGEL